MKIGSSANDPYGRNDFQISIEPLCRKMYTKKSVFILSSELRQIRVKAQQANRRIPTHFLSLFGGNSTQVRIVSGDTGYKTNPPVGKTTITTFLSQRKRDISISQKRRCVKQGLTESILFFYNNTFATKPVYLSALACFLVY